MALTPKQQAFINEYAIDKNATKAAIRAGYSPKTAYSIGEENLRKPEIRSVIDAEFTKRNTRLGLADWVLQRFKDISNRCMTAEPVMIKEGTEWVESGEYKFDSSGANKSTELIAKHLGMFTDKLEVSGSMVIFEGEKDLED